MAMEYAIDDWEDKIVIKKATFEPIMYHGMDLNEVVYIVLSALQNVSSYRYYGIMSLDIIRAAVCIGYHTMVR